MAAAAVATSSAAGLLALLDEPSDEIKAHALTRLDRLAADHWHELAGSVSSVEALYEDDQFPQRSLAALVASKVSSGLGRVGCAAKHACAGP
jgi:26S proteasome regulatory subunit N2